MTRKKACSTCSGSMTADEMRHASKEEIEEFVSSWRYYSGGWVCDDCGYPCKSWQVKEADPRRYHGKY